MSEQEIAARRTRVLSRFAQAANGVEQIELELGVLGSSSHMHSWSIRLIRRIDNILNHYRIISSAARRFLHILVIAVT